MSSKEPNLALNYDEVLEYIGQFGTFQRKIFFLLWLVSAAGGLAVVVFAFTGMFVSHQYSHLYLLSV
jgi:hypothetical protein